MHPGFSDGSLTEEEIMSLEDALKKMVEAKGTGQSLPLCRYCGSTHLLSKPCPARLCLMCGTTHIPNRTRYPHLYENCERNDKFYRKLAEREKWIDEETERIWAQPDKEDEEEE